MQVFRVDDMTCGHCASVITQAVLAVDGNAKIEVDLGQRQVRIDQSVAETSALRGAIAAAGYTCVVLDTQASASEQASRRAGCCGCCC